MGKSFLHYSLVDDTTKWFHCDCYLSYVCKTITDILKQMHVTTLKLLGEVLNLLHLLINHEPCAASLVLFCTYV
jgi:hypothetical protein